MERAARKPTGEFGCIRLGPARARRMFCRATREDYETALDLF